jgi:acetyltransferase
VEALGLVAVCLAPVDLELARELVGEAPGLASLASEPAREQLARVLVALGCLAMEHPEIAECDVNPLVLDAAGAVAVDALVVVSSDAERVQ